MNFRPLLYACLLVFGVGSRLHGADAPANYPAARVLILANGDDPDSVGIARHYAERRGVPAANIILLKLTTAESISRTEFDRTLFQPLQDELVKQGWTQGFPDSPPTPPVPAATPAPQPTGTASPAGPPTGPAATVAPPPARRYLIIGHRISYLVVCRGVPLRVEADPTRANDSKQALTNPVFNTNAAAVDSELALLAQSGYPLSGFVPNPLYHNDRPLLTVENQIVKVGRLDGPTAADALGLVDLALTAENNGLMGRSYVDLGGPFPLGDQWLDAAAKELAGLGFDGDVDRAPSVMPPEARCDAPVFYFGWYTGLVSGPFARPGFRFPPGAVALHIYSYSATTLRSTTEWTAGLVARGATAVFGNVTEPYLQLTHEPQLIMHALARGDSLGDAAAYSIPGYSWMGVLIGDPLYQPFKKSLDAQWRDLAMLPPEQRPYVVLRRMHLLEAGGKHAEAVATAREAQREDFSLSVALSLAELLSQAGDKDGAKGALTLCLTWNHPLKASDAPLLADVARQFSSLGDPKHALQAWQLLLSIEVGDLRPVWLKPALVAARAAQDDAQVGHWEAELKTNP